MGDFANKFTKNTFLERAQDNGWCIDEEDKYFFDEIYSRSNDPNMKAYDDILMFVMTNKVWDEKKYKDGIQFIKNSLDELLKSNKIEKNDYDVINSFPLADPNQEDIDKAKAKRDERIMKRNAFHKDFMDRAYKQGWSVNDNEVLEALYDHMVFFDGEDYAIGILEESAYDKFMSYTVDDDLSSEKLSAVRAFYNDINSIYLEDPKAEATLKMLNEVGINAILIKAMNKYEALAKEEAAKKQQEEKAENISPEQKKFNQAKKKAKLSELEIKSAQKQYRFDAQDDIKLKSNISDKKRAEMMNKLKAERVSKIKSVTYGFNDLVALKDVILADLRNYRAELSLTQSNQMANFLDKNQKEGSKEYKEMAKALQEGIEKLESKDVTIDEVSDVTLNVMAKAMNYHAEKHKGILGGPTTDNGIARDNIAFNMGYKMTDYNSYFRKVFKEKFKPAADKVLEGDAENINSMKLSEVNAKIASKKEAVEKYYKINIEDTKNLSVFEAKVTRTEIDKKTLITKVSLVLGVMNFDPDNYKFPKPTNAREAAKQYLLRKCIDTTKKPLVSSEEIRDMQEMISGKELDKNVEALANNKVFAHVYKTSKDFYNTYKGIEDRTEELRVNSINTLEGINKEYGSEKNFVEEFKGTESEKNLSRAEVYCKNLAEVLGARLLSDPQNGPLRLALASHQEREGLFRNYLLNYSKSEVKRITERQMNDSNANPEDFEPAKEILNTKNLNKKLLTGFAEAEKRYAKQNRMTKTIQDAEKTAQEVKNMIG